MYESFTVGARKVMRLADEAAQELGHGHIGTGHILLGLAKEGTGVAANALKRLDVNVRKILLEVQKIVQCDPEESPPSKRAQTLRVNKAVEYAIEEAERLEHKFVGTEHLLLGLLREEEGVAFQVLLNQGLNASDVRKEVLDLLGVDRDFTIAQRPVRRFPRHRRSSLTSAETEFAAGMLAAEVMMDSRRAGEVARRAALLTLEARLHTEIGKIPILDPHSHINPHSPAAKSFDEILGYHYYTELAHSAGMDKAPLVAPVPHAERVAEIAKFLPHIANTDQYTWLLEIARTFFDFSGDSIDETNIAQIVAAAETHMSAPDWAETVLRKSGVEKIFLTNDFDDPLEGFDTNRYVPCLRTDDLVLRLGDATTVQRLCRATNSEVHDARSLVASIACLFDHFTRRGAKACAISLPPDFQPVPVARTDVESSVRSVLRGDKIPSDDARTLEHFVFWNLALFCAEFKLPFDLMIGVNRRVYRAGVFQGQDLYDQRTSLYQYQELFNAFPRVTFPISVLTSNQNQELVSYAWIFPNVVPHGHWWYSNVPVYIEPDARARLTAVPANKQIGYYSDAYKLEFILPKFNMYRWILARILAQDFVIARGWSEEHAVQFARQVLRENVQRVFGI